MWKLTVEREYVSVWNTTSTITTDRMYFESNDIEELEIIIQYFDKVGTDGNFTYKLARKEREEHEAV